jgi:hypothetical protein
MGRVCQVPSKKLYDTACGMPLHWAERKPKKFWYQFLGDIDAKAVIDMTPGSGACARGCMDLGIGYTCIVRSPEHGSWIQNVLDRHALQNICEQGKPLFEQELSLCIKEHFQDTLDQLNEADEMEDADPGDGAE